MTVILAINGLPAVSKLTAPGQPASTGGQSFGHLLSSAVNHLVNTQSTAQSAITQAMLGKTSVTNAMVSMTEAQMTLDIAVSVTTNAQNAYQTIMNMPLG